LRPLVVGMRRQLARRPWLYWLAVAGVAAATFASVGAHARRVDRAAAEWGATRPVLVARTALAPGDPVVGDWREYPVALVPESALEAGGGDRIARHRLEPGEIVTLGDTVGGGPLAHLPDGWLAVAVIESPHSGARLGDRVQLAADGITLAAEAIVVGESGDATLIGVPAAIAALVPLAAEHGSLAVLRMP
jgi:hypothetical protein